MSNRWNGSGEGKFFSGGFQERMGEVELRPKHLSDQHVRAQIVERINVQLHAEGIEVEVEGGRVLLRGRVGSEEKKKSIERIVQSVQGVRAVESELSVQGEPTAEGEH
jgi:osmotically-inducible protein OsmY